MTIKNLQIRQTEVGRIRIGETVDTGRKNKNGDPIRRPVKLEKFRFTSPSQALIGQVATVYGGTPAEWHPQGGGAKVWEVYTDAAAVAVFVPPRAVSQWYESWSGGACVARCDGERELLKDRPCLCDPDPRQRKCKPTTRVSLMLAELPGAGVWRLESHGYYAATELPAMAELLAIVGSYAPGRLELEERTARREKADGSGMETRRWMVPVLHLDATPQQLFALTAGESRTAVGAAPERVAIEAPPQPEAAPERATSEQWRGRFQLAVTMDQLRAMWTSAGRDNALDDETRAAWQAAAQRFQAPSKQVDLDAVPADGSYTERDSWAHQIANAPDLPTLLPLMEAMNKAGVKDIDLKHKFWARKRELEARAEVEQGDHPVDVEIEPDRDETWNLVMSLAGGRGWKTDDVMTRFALHTDKEVADGTGWEYKAFADAIKSGVVA